MITDSFKRQIILGKKTTISRCQSTVKRQSRQQNGSGEGTKSVAQYIYINVTIKYEKDQKKPVF